MNTRQVLVRRDAPGEFAQGLRHQAGMQAHVTVAHFPIQLGLGDQRGHRIDHHNVHRARGHEGGGNLQRLLAVIRLRHQQVVHVHAQLPRIGRVQGVLGVDKDRRAAQLLGLGNHL